MFEEWKKIKKREIQWGSILVLVLMVWVCGSSTWEALHSIVASKMSTEIEESEVTIIIDPGHGSDDPGKVGIGGTLEKELNLEIGLKVSALLEDRGYEVIMTREDDTGILEGVDYSATADLAARVELINETNPALVVSIHQNSYTTESVKGPQVFYYTDAQESMLAAQYIQDELWILDTDSHREIKANDTYYLLAYSQAPTVIVECGFLSNASDEEKLNTTEYQEELAKAIVNGIEEYLYEMSIKQV